MSADLHLGVGATLVHDAAILQGSVVPGSIQTGIFWGGKINIRFKENYSPSLEYYKQYTDIIDKIW